MGQSTLRERVEAGAAFRDVRVDGAAHARVPELPDVIGDLGHCAGLRPGRRRGVIAERYRPLVEAMYQGLADVPFATEGAAGVETIGLKIRDAKISAPAQAKRSTRR